MPNEWIWTKDQLPAANVDVLVLIRTLDWQTKTKSDYWLRIGRYGPNTQTWSCEGVFRPLYDEVVAWQPLPELPKELKEK